MNGLVVLLGIGAVLLAGYVSLTIIATVWYGLKSLISKKSPASTLASLQSDKSSGHPADVKKEIGYHFTPTDLLGQQCFRNAEASATRLWKYIPPYRPQYVVHERIWINAFDNMMKRPPTGSRDVLVSELDVIQTSGVEDIEGRLEVRRSSIAASASEYPISQPVQNRITAPDMPVFVTQEDLNVLFDQYELSSDERREVLSNADRINDNVEKAFLAARERFEQVQSEDRKAFEQQCALWLEHKRLWQQARLSEMRDIDQCLKELKYSNDMEFRAEMILRSSKLPRWVPSSVAVKFDRESKILIAEHQFPNVEELSFYKQVQTKAQVQKKPLNQKEHRGVAARIYPLLTLKLATDLAALLPDNQVELIVVNGWVDLRNKSTGVLQRAFCSALAARTDELLKLEFEHVDPVAAFSTMKGNSSRSTEITPIAPTVRIDVEDPRFVDSKEILQNMEAGENLAAMDWEDFEHLCRELFERVFAAKGAIVKVTRAAKDQGVDAIINDPDPIMGGRIVIQAKRYVNVVDVSAVRDLAGTVAHEGAMKGLLVTTSHFGPDAYAFIQGKPLQLINGAELLGLLEKHGYSFRIDLEEARRLQKETGLAGFRSGKQP